MRAPNYIASSASALHGNVRVELVAPPVGFGHFGHGFLYTLAPNVARALAASLLAAADVAEKQSREVVAPQPNR